MLKNWFGKHMNNDVTTKQLDPNIRIHNYDEVVLGYTRQEAIDEANRCLNCINKPCVNGCPIHNDIPYFISKIKEGNFEDAYKIISVNSPIASICARVCPHENQCQKNCTRGIKSEAINIGALERYVSDNYDSKQIKQESNNHKIAIVGSGPSGLACAKQLALLGYDVTIIEEKNILGGILTYGIPKFRLPKKVVEKEINKIIDLGVHIKLNTKLGKDVTIEELLNEYECVYIAIGTSESKLMNIPGEELQGFYNANDFLFEANINTNKFKEIIKDKKVIVVGGGNVAMDVARSAIRLEAKKVDIVYRRSLEEMPASKDELNQTMEEHVTINYLVNPIRINQKDGKVCSISCVRMKLGEIDYSERRRPIEIKDSEFDMEADIVIEAISSKVELNAIKGITLNKYNYPITDENGKTNIERVYAGGDVVDGPSTVINAVKKGKIVADSIHKYLNNVIFVEE